MTDFVHVVIPYAGEPEERLTVTQVSAYRSNVYGIYVSRDTARSLPKTMNSGVRTIRQEGCTHICWLSTGDTLHPDRFKYPLPTDKGQCCRTYVQSRRQVYPDLATDWNKRMYRDNTFCGSGMVVPVHIWDAVGGFDESLTYCSDWDFAVRVQHQFGWECSRDYRVLATANEYLDGLTATADVKARQRDRAQVSRMANKLRKGTG